MIGDQTLALLANKLQIPVIVSDILNSKQGLTDDTRMAVHEILSDMEPIAALLTVALSARKIATIYQKASPSMSIINMECKKIIADFAPLWLQIAKGEATSKETMIKIMDTLVEDLECLSELLALNINFLQAKDETAAELLKILKIQTDAQALIAETIAQCLDSQNAQTHIRNTQSTRERDERSTNIIAFPGAA